MALVTWSRCVCVYTLLFIVCCVPNWCVHVSMCSVLACSFANGITDVVQMCVCVYIYVYSICTECVYTVIACIFCVYIYDYSTSSANGTDWRVPGILMCTYIYIIYIGNVWYLYLHNIYRKCVRTYVYIVYIYHIQTHTHTHTHKHTHTHTHISAHIHALVLAHTNTRNHTN